MPNENYCSFFDFVHPGNYADFFSKAESNMPIVSEDDARAAIRCYMMMRRVMRRLGAGNIGLASYYRKEVER